MDGPGATRILTRIWFAIVGVIAIAVLYLAKLLFVPLAFAILFAFLLFPLVAGLERIRLPRTVAALLVILSFFALLCAGTWLVFSQLVGVANDLPTYRANIQQKLAAIKSPDNSAFSRARQEVERLGDEIGVSNAFAGSFSLRSPNQAKPLGESPQHPVQVREVSHEAASLGVLGGAVEPLVTVLLTVVFTFFVLLQREDLRNRLIRLSGDRNLTLVTEAMDDASRRISRYFALLLTVNTVYGLIIFGALSLVGLPHAFLFGALAGMLRFIPYIGPPVATALPTLLSLAVFHGWEKSLVIIGIFACLEIVTANYVEPRVYGRHTGLSALAVLVAAAFWTLLWGPIGLLLSVPLTVCLVVMGGHVPALDFLTVMLGDRPPIPPWTSFYQRLLAHDEREATEILESHAGDRPLAEVFDSVLVPALALSEEDRLHRDLDESTLRFIRGNVREIIEEFSYREIHGAVNAEPTSITQLPAPEIPSLKVMSIPVSDETDELAALMLATALQGGKIHAFAIPVRRPDEIVEAVAREKPDITFLAGLPPFGFGRSHRIYQMLRARFPQLRIMAGIWNSGEDTATSARKISGSDAMRLFVSLTEAVTEIRAQNEGNTQGPSSEEAPPTLDSEDAA